MNARKSQRRPHGAARARSIVLIAALWSAVLAGISVADPDVAPAVARPRSFQILNIRGPGGETCQAQFNNVVFVFIKAVEDDRPEIEDVSEAVVPNSGPHVGLISGTADDFVFGAGQSAAVVSSRLDIMLRRQVGAINDLCDLTDVQLQKILLAGRGDIQRLLDRAGKLKGQIEKPVEIANVEQFKTWCTRLGQESGALGTALKSGPFDMQSLLAKTLRTTLTPEQLELLNRVKGNLVASTQSPARGAGPAVEQLRFDDPRRLETILKEWDLAATRLQRLDCRFIRMKYDPVFEVEFRSQGILAVDRQGRALYTIAAAEINPGDRSRKTSKGGMQYELKADSPDHWCWTGNSVIRVDDRAGTYEEVLLPRPDQNVEYQPERPALPENLGSGRREPRPAIKPDLTEVFDSLYEPLGGWAKPFLLGMPSDELKRRFKVIVLSEDDAEVRLQFEPIWPRDKMQFSSAQLILSRPGYRPRALKSVGPGGAETVHVFSDVAVNAPDERAPLGGPDLAGFRKIVFDRPTQR
jgi:hypothetical protein